MSDFDTLAQPYLKLTSKSTPHAVEVKDKVVRECMPFILKLASKGANFPSNLEDRVNFGMEALAMSLDRWDESKGVPFGAFAVRNIKQAFYRADTSMAPKPGRMEETIRVKAAASRLINRGQLVTLKSLAEESGRHISRIKSLIADYPLDELETFDDPQNNLEVLHDGDEVLATHDQSFDMFIFRESVLQDLTPNHAVVYDGLIAGFTYQEIATQLGYLSITPIKKYIADIRKNAKELQNDTN